MLRLLLIVFIATLLGCGRGGGLQQSAELPEWFCEMAENAEDWDCVQDPELARNPRPSRLPEPKAAAAAPSLAASPAQPAQIEPLLSEPPPPPPPPTTGAAAAAVAAEVPAQDEAPAAPEQPAPSPLLPAAEPASEIPTHIRLAYQPPSPMAIVDMPVDFYAVQLIAMSSRKRLEGYIDDNRFEGMTAARVERDGEIYFVLILGIYETRELAERASQDIPPPLDTREPWIRPLGALQEAMIRADAMAGGAPG